MFCSHRVPLDHTLAHLPVLIPGSIASWCNVLQFPNHRMMN